MRSATESLAQNKKLALKTEVAKSLPMGLGLSRSAVADRFIRLIGVPPMHLPRQLAHASRESETPQHQRIPRTGCRDCRLRLRGRFLPRVQEGVWCGARNLATFEQLGYVEANPDCWFELRAW